MAREPRLESSARNSDSWPPSQSPSPANAEHPTKANEAGNLKVWLWRGLLIAVVAGIIGSSLYVRHGGALHGETDMYLVAHLSERSFLSKIICPHSADAKFYEARPLSHLLENLDAHFVYWSYLAGYPHFFSVVTFGVLLGITCLHWHFGVHRLRLDKLTLLLLVALFWTNPNIYFAGMCLRTGKIAVAFFVYAGMCVFLSRMVRVEGADGAKIGEPDGPKNPLFLYFCLALAACFSDPQGVVMVLLLSGGAMVWSAVLKSKEALRASLAGGGACGVHTLFSLWLAPILVRKLSGFEVSNAFGHFDEAGSHSKALENLKEGASVTCDIVSFGFGDMPAWVFCAVVLGVLAAVFMLRTETATRRKSGRLKHPGILIGMTVVVLALANVAVYAVMIATHPPLAWDDILRGGYYPLPTVVFWFMALTVLLRLLQDRFRFSRGVVWSVLVVLLGFNAESLPDHFLVIGKGHLRGFIQATPSLLSELRRLGKEPAGKATARKYDTQKSSEHYEASTMLRNPMMDINMHAPIDVNAFLKSSRYLNFLRSKKGLDFYEPW